MRPASHLQPLRDPFKHHNAFPPQAQGHLQDGDFLTFVFENSRRKGVSPAESHISSALTDVRERAILLAG
jgi:hypothetical protein